jgi:DNA-binding beta-propeller fold protein YncE
MKKVLFLLSCLVFIVLYSPVKAQSNYKTGNPIRLEGDGGWDYLKVDEVNGKMYVSHGMVANVVDLKTGKSAGTIADTKGIHGIAIANDLNKGYTSNGRDSSVTVFNLKTLEVINVIHSTGKNPDAILYDSYSGKVFTFNGGSANATVIDAKTDKVIGTIALNGKPEFPQADGKGKVYVNNEDKSEINVINSVTLKVEQHWSIAPGEEPSGLALDNLNHLLFSVCGNKLMVVSDAVAGKVLTTLPIGDGCDGAVFDPVYKRVYASNGEGTMTVVQEVTPASFKVLETVQTHQGARTITLDNTTHHLYLSCAEYESAAAGSTGRPRVKPGSFMVLDIETIK